MPDARPVRIAVLGFMLETNRWSPVADKVEFDEHGSMAAEAIAAEIERSNPSLPREWTGFKAEMDRLRPWEFVPIRHAYAGASGPCDQAYLDEFVADISDRLKAALPLDGVYVCEHGAGVATEDDDLDGTVLSTVRDAVGPDVPIVATLDLHALVGERMVASTDALCAYLTNPHVDQAERGAEAARVLSELLDGLTTAKAFVRVPILPPQVRLLTARGPYADAVAMGQTLLEEDPRLLNVSVCGNFSFADAPKNGITVTVTSRGDQAAADEAAKRLAAGLWDDRERFEPELTSLEDAVALMKAVHDDPSREPVLFADVADNPGGGGRGNTTYVLKAFLDAGVAGVAFVPFYDRALAAEAHAKGVGARFDARLNRQEASELSHELTVPVEVMALSDGEVVGRRGSMEGRTVAHGPTAWLRLDDRIDLVVISIRHQALDPAQLEHLGIELEALRGIVVKSRGHFRAGFEWLIPNERIYEVDVPGLITPVLSRVDFKRVQRPIWPLDKDFNWSPPVEVAVR
ncbi:M81 family metallopeptidase [Acuticoccus sp.]|uniref:M81 family metallopeptidase n=1 Tax=Acuticoccus sp. TaxID=1904378 RepID=UPI003B519B5A